MNIVRNPHRNTSVPLLSHPLFWELREHHCLDPKGRLPPGLDDFGGDDFLNAWLPQKCEVKHLEVSVDLPFPTASPYDCFTLMGCCFGIPLTRRSRRML